MRITLRAVIIAGCVLGVLVLGVFWYARLMQGTQESVDVSDSSVQQNEGSVDQGSATTQNAAPEPSQIAASSAQIVFASDFASHAGCADHSESDQCDVFTANIDLSTGAVDSVTQRTNTSVSESYPAWNPNGTIAYASVFQSYTKKSLSMVDFTSGAVSTLIANATWPEVSPDGSTLLYVTSDTNLLMTAPLLNGGTSIGASKQLTGTPRQEDPEYSPDGTLLTFHQIMSDGARGTILNLASGQTVRYSDRTGHCAFSGFGNFTVCDNSRGGGLFKRTYTSGILGESSLFIADLKPAQLAAYDDIFAQCGGASFNYPTFCGDDSHMLVSASCNMDAAGGVAFSRLFLIDLSGANPVYRPIGKYLAETFGGKGMSSWTVDCLKK